MSFENDYRKWKQIVDTRGLACINKKGYAVIEKGFIETLNPVVLPQSIVPKDLNNHEDLLEEFKEMQSEIAVLQPVRDLLRQANKKHFPINSWMTVASHERIQLAQQYHKRLDNTKTIGYTGVSYYSLGQNHAMLIYLLSILDNIGYDIQLTSQYGACAWIALYYVYKESNSGMHVLL